MPTLAPLMSQLPDSASPLALVQDIPFNRLVADSRQVTEGDVFVLLKSQTPNATTELSRIAAYLDAVKDRAAFVVSELCLGDDMLKNLDLPVVCVPALRGFLGDLLYQLVFAGQRVPKMVAVTGTNGKTTISQLIAQLVSLAGKQALVLGTAGNGIWPTLSPSTHTTLQGMELFYMLENHQKADVVALEASSHGLHQDRLQGVPVSVAVFSNLSQDHLDYHESMAEYACAKARLFDKGYFTHLAYAIINIDDPFGNTLIGQIDGEVQVLTYSLTDPKATFFVKDITQTKDGSCFVLVTPKGSLTINSPLLGRFNIANVVASIIAVQVLGFDLSQVATLVGQLQGAKGRMQQVASSSGQFMVDYAHTPDALEQVLMSLKGHCAGRLWVVFGCGGDRDKSKRPLMASIARKHADCVVLTSDNPRGEPPEAILTDMTKGLDMTSVVVIPNREDAIGYAAEQALADDVVVIAGKGHETYQEIAGVRYDFDDVQVLNSALAQVGKGVV